METLDLNSPIINEMGAIQPCQIPVKKPAGLRGEYLPAPGKQDERSIVKANRLQMIRMVFRLFITC